MRSSIPENNLTCYRKETNVTITIKRAHHCKDVQEKIAQTMAPLRGTIIMLGSLQKKELMVCYTDEASYYPERSEWVIHGAEHHKWKTDLGARLGILLPMDDSP